MSFDEGNAMLANDPKQFKVEVQNTLFSHGSSFNSLVENWTFFCDYGYAFLFFFYTLKIIFFGFVFMYLCIFFFLFVGGF